MIPFNKIHTTGEEITYMNHAIKSGKIAGDGYYTKACEKLFEKKYGFKKALLTSSCTDALELAALLIDIKPGDEVIMPSYSFVSMANAFILRGAKAIFADSSTDNPNIDASSIEALVTPATKAIVVIHYGGVVCDIVAIKKIADKHGLYLIEDAAQAIDCFYNNAPLGSFGHLATFSFHETKNITCGEGGLLVINDDRFIEKAEISREKGTNRSSFIRHEVSKYTWVSLGSSFLTSDISAAYLYAQLNSIDAITEKRRDIWSKYYNGLKQLAENNIVQLPAIIPGAMHNGHIFYLTCQSVQVRTAYINYMQLNKVVTQFHYLPLHDSPFYKETHGGRVLPMAKQYENCLVRLPIFFDLQENEINDIIGLTCRFFLNKADID